MGKTEAAKASEKRRRQRVKAENRMGMPQGYLAPSGGVYKAHVSKAQIWAGLRRFLPQLLSARCHDTAASMLDRPAHGAVALAFAAFCGTFAGDHYLSALHNHAAWVSITHGVAIARPAGSIHEWDPLAGRGLWTKAEEPLLGFRVWEVQEWAR